MGARRSASLRSLTVLGMFMGLAGASRAQEPVAAPPETSTSKLIQSVSITPVVAFAGADMRVVVRVLPDAGNRRLQLSVDAPTFYASTERQLDGVDGARAHTFSLHELPAGEYQIVAVLEGSAGVRSRITRTFKVMGEDDTQVLESPRPTTRRRRGSE
ncbi:MAG TPA: hypothetical protein VMF13_11880 [Luteitalea sp.]|nr:hypothetical protein [Luteitalea sp.]